MQLKDHYKTLSVGRTASREEIKAAYRELAKKYHPDKNQGNKAAEDTFKEVQEAYTTLFNSEKRRNYDLKLKHGRDFSRTSYQGPSYQPATYYTYSSNKDQRQKQNPADDFAKKQRAAAAAKEDAMHSRIGLIAIIIVLFTIGIVFYSQLSRVGAPKQTPPMINERTSR